MEWGPEFLDGNRADEYNKCLENYSRPGCPFILPDHVWNIYNFYNYLPDLDKN